jgi:hypothetical protein
MGFLDLIAGKKSITPSQYHSAAVLIRVVSIKTASQLSASDHGSQFMFTMTDLIGYFSAQALLIAASKEKPRTTEDKLKLLEKLRAGFRIDDDGPEEDDLPELRPKLSRWVDSDEYEQLCSGYLGGDLPLLGITPSEVQFLTSWLGEKNMTDIDSRRTVALLARCVKHLNPSNILTRDGEIYAFYSDVLSNICIEAMKNLMRLLTGKAI